MGLFAGHSRNDVLMRKAFLISLTGHFSLLVIFWAWSLLFGRPRLRSYPRTMTANFVVRQPQKTAIRRALNKTVRRPPSARAVPAKKSKRARKRDARSARSPNLQVSRNADRSSPATSGSALKIDAKEFPYPEYLALIQYRIETQWHPPRNTRGELLTTIYFKITRGGRLQNIRVEQTCGAFVVDQAALRAVYAANPLPPLPEASGLASLGVHFDFVIH